jgi:hypothetical protein
VHFANAQSIKMNYLGEQTSITNFITTTNAPSTFSSEVEINMFLQNALNDLRKKGFLAASIDSLLVQNEQCFVKPFMGKQYKWASINAKQVPQVMLNNVGYNAKQFSDQPITETQFANLTEKLLRYCENNGYPFAQIYLANLQETAKGFQADLRIDTNNFIKIDSIDVQGDVEITNGFLFQYLGVQQGDVYNETILKNISNRIRELSFLKEEKPWRFSFSLVKNTLTLYLAKKDANRADLLVGLLPNNNALGGKFLLTGDVKLALVNSLRGGETVTLNWQNLQYKSPRLIVEMNYPYLFNTPIGTTAKFHYTKNDSSFRNVIGELSANYLSSANRFVKFYFQTNNSATITVDTFSIKANKVLPSNIDLNSNLFGVEWQWNATDYKLNPRKGFSIAINGNVGIRNILRNTTIENLYDASSSRKFAYLYDSVASRSYKYTGTVTLNYFLPITKRLIVRSNYNGGVVYNPTLFRNELFQIGGYRLLRGFDEASLFVNQYHVASLEPRYILSQNSFLFTFLDGGLIQSPYLNNKQQKNALGVGAGISLETKNGLFNFVYALGNNLGGGIQFRNSKIHFGYVNTF